MAPDVLRVIPAWGKWHRDDYGVYYPELRYPVDEVS